MFAIESTGIPRPGAQERNITVNNVQDGPNPEVCPTVKRVKERYREVGYPPYHQGTIGILTAFFPMLDFPLLDTPTASSSVTSMPAVRHSALCTRVRLCLGITHG